MHTASTSCRPACSELQLLATQDAFDSVAVDYDGARGNNAVIQEMRAEMWRWLDRSFAAGSRLIDIGCGTGLDAIRMAQRGHHVTATDWSPRMIDRTAARAALHGVAERVTLCGLGAQQFDRLAAGTGFDGAYSNLGPLNCAPDLRFVARECARLLKPGGKLVFSVIGRLCPWELLHYARRGRWRRALLRLTRGFVPVGMNRHTVWTHYYRPREFYRAFEPQFELERYRGLCVFVPPPYLTWLRERHAGWQQRLWRLDRCVAGWPVLRACGDHFLIIMRRR